MRKTAIFGGNRDNTSNSGSRASNWNNNVWNSNWNIGCRFACEHSLFALAYLTGYAVRSLSKWSAHLSRVSKYITGSVQGGVARVKYQDGKAAYCGN